MFYADYHTHTNFSSDSSANMVDMIEKAASLELSEIAITDHIDFDYPNPNFPFIFDFKEYNKSIDACIDLYKNKINILCGVEIGFQPHVKEEIEDFVRNGNFDIIICSTHCADKIDLASEEFFIGKTKEEAYNIYLDNVLNSIKLFDNFNVYGHIDFINRYGRYIDKSLKYSEYSQKIDEILKLLISKGKGIEINTSGLRYGVGSTHPQFEILKRYHDLGGEIITIGSDAHTPNNIAQDFDVAYNMLTEAGFRHLTIFRNQKPDWINIDKLNVQKTFI